jgi:hypothetical protein
VRSSAERPSNVGDGNTAPIHTRFLRPGMPDRCWPRLSMADSVFSSRKLRTARLPTCRRRAGCERCPVPGSPFADPTSLHRLKHFSRRER